MQRPTKKIRLERFILTADSESDKPRYSPTETAEGVPKGEIVWTHTVVRWVDDENGLAGRGWYLISRTASGVPTVVYGPEESVAEIEETLANGAGEEDWDRIPAIMREGVQAQMFAAAARWVDAVRYERYKNGDDPDGPKWGPDTVLTDNDDEVGERYESMMRAGERLRVWNEGVTTARMHRTRPQQLVQGHVETEEPCETRQHQ